MYGLTREGRWEEARAIWERILPLEEVVYGHAGPRLPRPDEGRAARARRHRVDRHAAAAPAGRRGHEVAVREALAAAGLLPPRVA